MMKQDNAVYLFIPFRYDEAISLQKLHAAMQKSGMWTQVQDENMYMLKYVADKMDCRDPEKCRCFHYVLSEDVHEKLPYLNKNQKLLTASHLYREHATVFEFELQSIHLYCFSTGVCMMAFQVHFLKNEPFWISSALYYMKKVSKEKLYIFGQTEENAEGMTMLEMAKQLMAPVFKKEVFDFFFYANPSTERANVLTFMEVEQKHTYKQELYYLRRCYSEGFLYTENPALDAKEIYSPSTDVVWGISPEAATCLVCPKMGRENFLRTTFYKNFNAQYLFMYVLLLHQKYALYMMLTKIGVGVHNDLDMLENYRRQLYEFETDFVFTCVTEVEQYQRLYAYMTEAFSLKRMFEDVREPLISLGEIRQKEAEKKQKNRDNKLNYALTLFSLLGLFSALTDSVSLAQSISNAWFSGQGVHIIQGVFTAVILGAFWFVLRNVFGRDD